MILFSGTLKWNMFQIHLKEITNNLSVVSSTPFTYPW
jgi:hypothetical protein